MPENIRVPVNFSTVLFLTRTCGGTRVASALRQKPCDSRFELAGLIPAAGPHIDLTVLVHNEMSRKAHIDIALPIAVGILQNYSKAVRQNVEIERRASQVSLDLRLVFHGESEENHVLLPVSLNQLVQLRDLAVADVTSGRPECNDHNAAFQPVKVIDLSVYRRAGKLWGRRTFS